MPNAAETRTHAGTRRALLTGLGGEEHDDERNDDEKWRKLNHLGKGKANRVEPREARERHGGNAHGTEAGGNAIPVYQADENCLQRWETECRADMPAGIATAVPNPLMPSMKPPKHQATSNARTRRSVESEVIIDPITSMAPVRTHRL